MLLGLHPIRFAILTDACVAQLGDQGRLLELVDGARTWRTSSAVGEGSVK
jgi:hypothetical protein